MDPKVVELLEGKPDEHKYQAIAYSFACLLTGPKGNTSRDARIKPGEIFSSVRSFLLLFRAVFSSD